MKCHQHPAALERGGLHSTSTNLDHFVLVWPRLTCDHVEFYRISNDVSPKQPSHPDPPAKLVEFPGNQKLQDTTSTECQAQTTMGQFCTYMSLFANQMLTVLLYPTCHIRLAQTHFGRPYRPCFPSA